MLTFLEILTICVSIVFTFISLKSLNRSSIYIYHLIFVMLLVCPLCLDYLFGKPNYANSYPLFLDSYDDTATRYIYSAFILLTQFFILYYAKKNKNKYSFAAEEKESFYDKYSINLAIWLGAISTPLLAICFRMPIRNILTWGWRYDGYDVSSIIGYGSLERLTYISIISAAILLIRSKKLRTKIFTLLVIYINVCIEGKRSAIFFAVATVIICYLLLYERKIKISKLIIPGIICVFILVALSLKIQSSYRGYDTFEGLYRMIRVDFFRDDTVKSVIYLILHPEKGKVLDYPGQSLIMQLGFLFPLIWLPIPKVGYETYLTAALKYRDIYSLPNTVRMTPSIYDCLFANTSFLALFIIPIFIIVYSRYTDKATRSAKPILVTFFLMYSMYSLSYICWFIEFWLIVIFLSKRIRVTFGKK